MLATSRLGPGPHTCVLSSVLQRVVAYYFLHTTKYAVLDAAIDKYIHTQTGYICSSLSQTQISLNNMTTLDIEL